MKILFALLILVCAAGSAQGQRRDTSAYRAAPDPLVQVQARPAAGQRIAVRSLSGFVGTVVGGVAGATMGYQATYRGDGGEDPGLDGLLVGAIVGGAVGATVGAALPRQGSRCTMQDRVARGLVGSGAVAAAFLTAHAYDGTEVVIAFPAVAPLVAAIASDC